MIYPIFSLNAVVTSCKKNQKNSMHQFVIKKTFWVTFCPKTPVQDFSPKKSFESTLSIYANVASCKKSEKFCALVFHEI